MIFGWFKSKKKAGNLKKRSYEDVILMVTDPTAEESLSLSAMDELNERINALFTAVYLHQLNPKKFNPGNVVRFLDQGCAGLCSRLKVSGSSPAVRMKAAATLSFIMQLPVEMDDSREVAKLFDANISKKALPILEAAMLEGDADVAYFAQKAIDSIRRRKL